MTQFRLIGLASAVCLAAGGCPSGDSSLVNTAADELIEPTGGRNVSGTSTSNDPLPVWQGEVTNNNGGGANGNDNSGGDNDNTNDNSGDDGNVFTIEPDDYEEGADLTNISPHVVLTTALDDNEIAELFIVTANDDGLDRAPTGDKVFGHANVYFFNNDRRLRLDFVTPASEVRVVFAGGTFAAEEIGRLEAYDSSGAKVGEYVTQPKGPGESEQMIVSSPNADIALVLAYVAAGEGDFGRMDAISYTLAAP